MNENIHNTQQSETMREDSFMKKLLKKRLNQKGLTLIELLAVIVILAIIAAIAIPAIGGLIDNSRYNAVKADAINVLNAANLYYTESPSVTGPVSVTSLTTAGFLDNSGKIPAAATITKGNPHTLQATVTNYSGTKSVRFNNASIQNINADTTRGSAIDDGQTATISSASTTITP